MTRYYLASAADGQVVVVTQKPEHPAAVYFRTLFHAEAIATRLNEEAAQEKGSESEPPLEAGS